MSAQSTHTRDIEREQAHVPQASTSGRSQWPRWLITALLLVSGLLTLSYVGISSYIATKLVYEPQKALVGNPAKLGLSYANVTFPAREDGVQLKGWFIPGVLSDGRLTADRALIMVHGTRANRTDPAAGLLNLSGALARQGFAILAFDMRGMGQSPPAPLSMGYYEQRDVLGAVDFLRNGNLPYSELGRPRVIGGWGVSMGAASLLFAAAREPAIRAVVSDSAYFDITPILEREIPLQGGMPAIFTPGAFVVAQALYGVNFYNVRPVNAIGNIAPHPVLLIHGAADDYIPPSHMERLAMAGSARPNAHIETWLVPGAKHAQSFNVLGAAYVTRVVAFFTVALGPDQSATR